MYKGFTTAEVLITLGILGIIMSMTIPNIIQDHRKRVVATQLKKAVNMLNQSLMLSSVTNGTPDEWGITNGAQDTFTNYIAPFIDIDYKCPYKNVDNTKDLCNNKLYSFKTNSSNYIKPPKYILKNGLAIFFDGGGTLTTSQRRGVFYIMTELGANKYILGKNIFTFNLIVKDGSNYWITGTKDYRKNKSFCNGLSSRINLIDMCENGASNSSNGGQEGYTRGITCSALIECNGWEIPDDYPIKF